LTERDTAEDAVPALVALGDARVKFVLARVDAREVAIYQDRPVFVPASDTEDGVTIYPLTVELDDSGRVIGEPIATIATSELADFRAQRKARKGIRLALSVIGLYLEDPVERGAAAKEVGNKRLLESLPRLRELADSDANAKVQRLAEESVQLIVLSGTDPEADQAARIAAAVRLGELDSIRGLQLLQDSLKEDWVDGAAAKAIATSIGQIERHQVFTDWVQHAFSGLSLGSVLLLIALGLAITFGLMGVINMAHGEMLMIGAVTSWACFEFIGTALPPAWFDWYYVIAAPAAFLTAGCVGLLTEQLIVRWLYKRPLDSMLATIGLSFVLIQAVRNWKGDNLGMTSPGWFSGGWEIMQDVILPYNRLFIIFLTITALLSVVWLFKCTRFGLMLRATVQNREVAASLGVNTRMVDMLTFGLGAGLAGIAGYALVLITNPTPEMGQTYIVNAFLVTVVGGVGKLMGVIVSGLGLGAGLKFIEPLTIMETPIKIFDAAWAQVAVLLIVIVFMTRKPSGLFPDKGRAADQADATAMPWLTRITPRTDLIYGSVLIGFGAIVVPMAYGMGWMSGEYVNKLGYIFAFAICAIGLDLLWGYMGVLSLCQFLFFALGGYAMGLYLINHGPKAANGIPQCLAYVMSDVGDVEPPWFLAWFDSFPGAVALGILLPGLLALIIGLMTFRSRVRGVYFAILTQAVTVAAKLVFEKNDVGLGGTNGLTKFETILGFNIASNDAAGPFGQTRFWLYAASFLTLLAVIAVSKLVVKSGIGRVLVAIRDDETRLRFNGYRPWAFKALIFALAGIFAAIGGMLYVPQKGIITPHQMAPAASILVVAWVAFGGRGTLWGAVMGAIVVSLLYVWMTSFAADYWMFVLGAMFIAVPLGLPGGLASVPGMVRKAFGEPKGGSAPPPVAPEGGAA
jgi:urea transport system permease protein